MRVLLLSEAGHEAERAAEEDRGAAGEAGVPHVGHLVQYSTVQYSTVQYSTVQYSTVQYSTCRTPRTGGGAATSRHQRQPRPPRGPRSGSMRRGSRPATRAARRQCGHPSLWKSRDEG